MYLKSLAFMAVLITLMVTLSCNSANSRDSIKSDGKQITRDGEQALTPGSLSVKLRIVENDDLSVTISNETKEDVVFCPRRDFVICYYVSPSGARTSLTFDEMVDMAEVGPFMMVYLNPKSLYTMRFTLKNDAPRYVDYRPYLKKKGTIYAVVKPVGFLQFKLEADSKKVPILKKALYSNKIEN